MSNPEEVFDSAFDKAIALGNEVAEGDRETDVWDVGDGLLAGAIQYWLYSRQPCGDPRCDECAPISTAEGRMAYYHSPSDSNVGRA